MAAISIRTEQELVTRLLSGPGTREFRESRLAPKVARERQARALLEQAEGRYTADSLNYLFDTVDHEELTGRPWFGQLLNAPNRNQMFESGPGPVGRWIDELLFPGHDFQHSLNACATDLKVKGAGKGLATLLLYLADPLAYNVSVPATERGLELLGRASRSNEAGSGAPRTPSSTKRPSASEIISGSCRKKSIGRSSSSRIACRWTRPASWSILKTSLGPNLLASRLPPRPPPAARASATGSFATQRSRRGSSGCTATAARSAASALRRLVAPTPRPRTSVLWAHLMTAPTRPRTSSVSVPRTTSCSMSGRSPSQTI